MITIKKILRISGLVIIIILASAGVGIFGAILPNNRERFMDNEIKIGMVDKEKEGKKTMDLYKKLRNEVRNYQTYYLRRGRIKCNKTDNASL